MKRASTGLAVPVLAHDEPLPTTRTVTKIVQTEHKSKFNFDFVEMQPIFEVITLNIINNVEMCK